MLRVRRSIWHVNLSAGAIRSRILRAATILFAITVFTASALLFFVQPMFAKLVLPRLGGSPAVWNTCMLFFQTALLLGYLYAHLAAKWLGTRLSMVHMAVVLLPLLCLPLSAGDLDPTASSRPITWLLHALTTRVGLPFFALATTAPLLQRLFAMLPLASARDPYFLYSASNLGSLLALVGYPLAIEPAAGLTRQSVFWAAAYGLFIVFIFACLGTVLTIGGRESRASLEPTNPIERVGPRERAWWVVLAFAPSSLMLGVTLHISTDIAAVPLLWIAPLAIYLLTFVIAFSPRRGLSQPSLVRTDAALVIASLSTILVGVQHSWLIPLHLVTLFCTALSCHSMLAARRPPVSELTGFYLWMSFGGTLGGVFNTLVAPRVFPTVVEYPLVLTLMLLILPPWPSPRQSQGGSITPLVFGSVILSGIAAFWLYGNPSSQVVRMLVTAAVAIIVLLLATYGLVVAKIVATGLVLLIAADRPPGGGTHLLTDRSFFGVVRVTESDDHTHRILRHGSTLHGWQSLTVSGCEPSSYYGPLGPIGDVMRVTASHRSSVAVIGLGTGALACYAKPMERWVFYEIDPLVEKVARDSRYFTHLAQSAGKVEVRLGDGRTTLVNANAAEYDLLVLDAFSSDAIPVHLLTVEAVQLYLSRLQPDGILAVHISNRYLNLEPLLQAISSRQGLHALTKDDRGPTTSEYPAGRNPSHWVAIARESGALNPLAAFGWRPLRLRPTVKPWTDDYSNIFSLITRD